MTTTIRDLMTTRLESLDATASALDAARCMRDEDIGDVLVTRDGKLCGVVTDRDLVVRCLAEQNQGDVKVGDICSTRLITISPDDQVDQAVKLMSDNALRRLPVVEDGKPVGIVSLGDLAVERDRNSALGDVSAAPANQ